MMMSFSRSWRPQLRLPFLADRRKCSLFSSAGRLIIPCHISRAWCAVCDSSHKLHAKTNHSAVPPRRCDNFFLKLMSMLFPSIVMACARVLLRLCSSKIGTQCRMKCKTSATVLHELAFLSTVNPGLLMCSRCHDGGLYLDCVTWLLWVAGRTVGAV